MTQVRRLKAMATAECLHIDGLASKIFIFEPTLRISLALWLSGSLALWCSTSLWRSVWYSDFYINHIHHPLPQSPVQSSVQSPVSSPVLSPDVLSISLSIALSTSSSSLSACLRRSGTGPGGFSVEINQNSSPCLPSVQDQPCVHCLQPFLCVTQVSRPTPARDCRVGGK
ncbi:hypothetical protein N658DRAFT_207561 [Parathielavia hyrcaniae]|uniref:Uncharacterized protein n=1 Tax=Parathielavia hyrcaniae TaxID=113614 RepID=A0AAN6SZV4_9PEZI|nr:hypothetical protein N658DRAFT_207561 [Parathielavia hyrcaniae]